MQSPSGLAGFVYVRGIHNGPRVTGEFFVVRASRRSGAAAFWRRTAAELVGSAWSEERRPVPDKPEVPPDVWLMLDVP